MSSASASGRDEKSAKFREHSHGRQDREYNPEQKAAVERIKKCKATAYYEILAVTKDASELQIKKAYHKLSLQTHPDKNGAPGADEAFKLVSKAFQVLSDQQKRAVYDQTGSDPESRGGGGGGGGAGGSPFPGFATRGAGAGFQADISPEDLFNMFFAAGGAGGGFGGFGGFGDGAGGFASFGGPGIRVHQFGGAGPRMRRRATRPPTAEEQAAANQPVNITRIFWQLLPLILFFLLPAITSFLSGDSSEATRGPKYEMNMKPPYTSLQHTPDYKIPFWVNPIEVEGMSRRDKAAMDKAVQTKIIRNWTYGCRLEQQQRQQEIEESQGIFFTDHERLDRAKRMPMPSCRKLEDTGIRKRGSHY
ncbi:hypothetical protein EDC01DRAFT_631928 [Geopyxis carbonaria]|nr:hypothetical protein EDC01DRAFT_631928 [Geopyxis carbonaria]